MNKEINQDQFNGEFDPPRLPTETDISSLGIEWPVNWEGSFDRVRGGFPELVSTEEQVESITRIQEEALKMGKRPVIKAISRVDDLMRLRSLASIEAAPGFRWNGIDMALTYFSANPKGRLDKARKSISSIDKYLGKRIEYYPNLYPVVNIKTLSERLKEAYLDGYRVRRAIDSDIHALSGLYTTFGWNEDEIGRMVANPRNRVYMAIHDDELIGAVMTEQLPWLVSGLGTLNIGELTEGVVVPGYRGNGLIVVLCILATNEFFEGGGGVVYTEDNIMTTGGLSYKVGRNSSVSGFEGVLRAHVPVEDGIGDELSCFYPSALSVEEARELGYLSEELNALISEVTHK